VVRPDSRPETRKSAADLKQARVVQGRARLGAGVEDVPDLVGEDRRGRVGVLDRERPAEAATLGALRKVDELEPANCPQQSVRRVADT
jgi:hypothetical protein